MKHFTRMNRTFIISSFVIFVLIESPTQCNANGILGTQDQSESWKESVQSIFGLSSKDKHDIPLNVSEPRKSEVQ